jgi:hypothetical protein
MPNPNYSEYIVRCKYGPDANTYLDTKIAANIADDQDQLENRFMYEIANAPTTLIHIDMYTQVKAVIVQNITYHTYGAPGEELTVSWTDQFTGNAFTPSLLDYEYVIFNVPDPTVDIVLYATLADKTCAAHVVIIGNI